ncbi:tRNA ligase [Trichodelitschia bisporula]|uniref:tRNA ligase n=1 Tax=Trichodelitschia bisporula TaxID=703511 RepID=A0A6G1HZK2_9PEZI|nr:tRNA ligase [Trichodelitschia bisporula]
MDMEHRSKPPYHPQDVGKVSAMLESLESHQKKGRGKGGFSVRKSTFALPNGRSVDSWRMQDWDYKLRGLPTYARGLFTTKNYRGQPEIVVRGYDKFFNHGEVRDTHWAHVQAHTRGPYELSVKENGCIIFIAGLDDESLIVCSKHSTGDRGDAELSHAVAGERWVERHLQSVGKTNADLARKLREMNATAVAELCDDSFEEHVLPYNPEVAGLYLHGINLNLPEFVTYPGNLVEEFADEWGFKKTMYTMEKDIMEAKKFLDSVAETGVYNGRETEGFVVRCQARASPDTPWYDWFFKYKFEEPYLMYRQWRECTKAMISGRTPRIKKHKQITEQYLLYARRRLAENPNLGKLYNLNHGIISLRNDFLASRGLKGSDVIRQEIENGEGPGDVTRNVVLVPIATIGCGKTTVALALNKLFKWGHFQNDNITGRGSRPLRFATAVCDQLAAAPVVIADRNNHQRRERDQLIKDVSKMIPNATFVALHWVHERRNLDEVLQAMQDRVFTRGDNHQTIQAGTNSREEVTGIMKGFLQRFEPCDTEREPDSNFDLVIDLQPTAPSRENLEIIVSRLNSEYPTIFDNMPTASDLDEAIEQALNEYTPDIKHELQFGKAKRSNEPKRDRNQPKGQAAGRKAVKEPKVEFFAARVSTQRVQEVLDRLFVSKPSDVARFYNQLKGTRRMQSEFHVTLVHRLSAGQDPGQWEQLCALHQPAFGPLWEQEKISNSPHPPEPGLGHCRVQLERVIWDDRVMCFVVRLINDSESAARLFKTVNRVAHITVGTASPSIKPVESNALIDRWLQNGGDSNSGVMEAELSSPALLDANVVGVLQRL